ncbi:hypothetical protein GCM10022295_82200 [Streptomyces osmaniensis]|uniref:Uncharacterized protein n=1 Tax=Streptomyces osmaniensis TaxID=593134 RepID=A0ABP6YUL8_9ACTN
MGGVGHGRGTFAAEARCSRVKESASAAGLVFGAGHRAVGVDLDDDVTVDAGEGETFQRLGAGLVAAFGNELLVLRGAPSVRLLVERSFLALSTCGWRAATMRVICSSV